MREFEYRVIDDPHQPGYSEQVKEFLDEYGSNGWEFCGLAWGFAIFKRERKQKDNG